MSGAVCIIFTNLQLSQLGNAFEHRIKNVISVIFSFCHTSDSEMVPWCTTIFVFYYWIKGWLKFFITNEAWSNDLKVVTETSMRNCKAYFFIISLFFKIRMNACVFTWVILNGQLKQEPFIHFLAPIFINFNILLLNIHICISLTYTSYIKNNVLPVDKITYLSLLLVWALLLELDEPWYKIDIIDLSNIFNCCKFSTVLFWFLNQ